MAEAGIMEKTNYSVFIVGKSIPKEWMPVYEAIASSFSVSRIPKPNSDKALNSSELGKIIVQFYNSSDLWSLPDAVSCRDFDSVLIRIGSEHGDIGLINPKPKEVTSILKTIFKIMDGNNLHKTIPPFFMINGWTICFTTGSSVKNNRKIHLGRKEIKILYALFEKGSLGVSRSELIQLVWGGAPRVGKRALDQLIFRLRQKGIFPKSALYSLPCGGYSLNLKPISEE